MPEKSAKDKPDSEKQEAKQEIQVETQEESEAGTPQEAGEKQEEKQEKPEARKASRDDRIIFVGKKPAMSYVMAVITQFSDGAKEVEIMARGRSISRAVDVAEVVKNRFMSGIRLKIEIGTDKIQDEQGNQINVSTIDITLTK
jgi:DNA-binding protein Alba